jgi:hypothetical protein
MLQGTAVSSKDTADLMTIYNLGISKNALFGSQLHNVLVVGSSDYDGTLSTFSNLPADVCMVGGHYAALPV